MGSSSNAEGFFRIIRKTPPFTPKLGYLIQLVGAGSMR